MLDLLLISAGIAMAQPAAAPDDFDLDAVIAQQMAVEDADDDEQWMLPSLVDLPEEDRGARLKLRGKKIKFSVPI
ncbi:hypothetical protein ASE00_11380 [Sphingomonas sp. Root710]|uniref:hypothetical protein n=1 Tax=Sphingomonas sp. Root710 TaxID=1736594 RepID=UPI00070086C6|nr:hypothetical protein [Sphingomonas sp. Root710]KRB82634.1 hypothetical protein ASE00_11380 [Sphingomonas sp. Root710]